jgi:hypothetical protein
MSALGGGRRGSVGEAMTTAEAEGEATTVAIFARAPVPGAVKTRLAGAVGADGAAALATAFLRDTWDAVAALPWARPAVATTGPLGAAFADVRAWDQGEGDLGARIERMLRRGLAETPTAISMGADTPGLPARLLEEARAALAAGADAVFGPCSDGGFYLVGVRRCPPGLLAELPWSRSDTLAATRARVEAHGLSVVELAPWFDVDRPEDLTTLEERLAAGEVVAPATARALAALRGGENTANDAAKAQLAPGSATAGTPRISVIVPTLNEEARIGRRLAELAATPGLHEVIVVDGGSADGTVALARAAGGARVIAAERGRARQQNAGARAASGDVLLFLHADVGLPRDAATWVARALSDAAVVAGAFRTWTVADGAQRAWLGPLLHLADVRSRYSGLPYGDQALFVRTSEFWAVGGFPDVPLMEDLALAQALRRRGRIRVVSAAVEVSGRRFQARPVYYTALVNAFPLLFRLGVPARVLAALYGAPR